MLIWGHTVKDLVLVCLWSMKVGELDVLSVFELLFFYEWFSLLGNFLWMCLRVYCHLTTI